MSFDPRKPILHLHGKEGARIKAKAHQWLLVCTEEAAKNIGIGGAEFVLLGMAIWTEELTELDQAATAKMLKCLSVLFNPSSSNKAKERAERERREAVQKLFTALDLEMNKTGGTG